ncbi:B12-binding domain-containing radical SAM protein, partial [Patescibacteria group bacterium]
MFFKKDERLKVLGIWPKIPITYWSLTYALKFISLPLIRPKKAAIPPIGLATVAAMFPRDRYQVKIVDMNIDNLTRLIIGEADLVIISGMLIQKESFTEVVSEAKKLGKKVIAGGPYVMSSHQEILNVDTFILGEAEVNFPPFLEDFNNGRILKKYYNDPALADMTKSPLPRFDLLNLSKYGSAALQISRGCPYPCEFCDVIEMFGNEMRMKTSQQVIAELNALYDLGWRGAVFIVDDNLIGHKSKIKKLLAIIANWQTARGYPFDFFTEASINMATDDELLKLMALAGINMVFIGIETPEEKTLISMGKTQNLKMDILESIWKIQSYGIEVSGGFIVGSDSDSSNIFQQQIEFIQNSGIVMAMVGLLQALPNTKLWKRLKNEGRLLPSCASGNNTQLGLNFTPIMDPKVLVNGYKEILANIYEPKKYFERCRTFLERVNPHQNSVRKVRLEEIYSFVTSLLRQGNPGSSYWQYYLKYLKDAISINPKLFPEAVRQAIMGHHFFKVTKQII